MKTAVCICSLLVVTLGPACCSQNSSGYFQVSSFPKPPSRVDDSLTFFTAKAPPLVCELDRMSLTGHITKPDFNFYGPRGLTHYKCNFQVNNSSSDTLDLFQKSIPNYSKIFANFGSGLQFHTYSVSCLSYSELPDEFFEFMVQRPQEERSLKCSIRGALLYLVFPGYPTIVCKMGDDLEPQPFYYFNLTGIVNEQFQCAFQVYWELRLADTDTEERLHRSLISALPARRSTDQPWFSCRSSAVFGEPSHFQIRLSSGKLYHCRFIQS